PLQLALEKKPDLNQRLLLVPPVDLDKLLRMKHTLINQRGKDLLTVPSALKNIEFLKYVLNSSKISTKLILLCFIIPDQGCCTIRV
ncbi:MAG: hypothetical protein V2A70_05695, partial [Candidatus Omnitrophota bacterium]